MSNQKFHYRKILTSDRTPTKEGFYLVKFKKNDNYADYFFFDALHCEDYMKGIIDWWLEEIPDNEQLLIDLLERALNLLDDFPYKQSLQERRANLNMNAQNLIWKMKNNTPKLMDNDTNE